jgi:GT2 family glycosyltransferase
MSDAPLVSVIILSFNSAHLLPRAVQSIREQQYDPIELIIVDNGSTDGTETLLDEYECDATIVRQGINSGFARGMNAGYDRSRGDVIIPLNTDAVLSPTFIQNAIRRLREHPDIGIIAPEVVKIAPDGPWRFWTAPHALPSEGGVVALNALGHVNVLEGDVGDWRPSFKANGACPVIRRAVVEQMRRTFSTGPFDPVFDTYGEDVDFAFKAWALRWHTMYSRDVLAGHVRSYASALHMPDKRGRLRINLLAERPINAIRHLPPRHMLAVIMRSLVNNVGLIISQRRKGDREIARDVAMAWFRVLRLLPDLIRFRRQHVTWRRIDFQTEVYCR